MDLMRPVDVDSARLFVEKYASESSDILKEDFYNSLLAAYTIDEVEVQLREKNLDYLSVESVSDRHMIIWGTFNGY